MQIELKSEAATQFHQITKKMSRYYPINANNVERKRLDEAFSLQKRVKLSRNFKGENARRGTARRGTRAKSIIPDSDCMCHADPEDFGRNLTRHLDRSKRQNGMELPLKLLRQAGQTLIAVQISLKWSYFLRDRVVRLYPPSLGCPVPSSVSPSLSGTFGDLGSPRRDMEKEQRWINVRSA